MFKSLFKFLTLRVKDKKKGGSRWSKASVTAAVLVGLKLLQLLGIVEPGADLEKVVQDLDIAIVGLIAIFMRQAINEG